MNRHFNGNFFWLTSLLNIYLILLQLPKSQTGEDNAANKRFYPLDCLVIRNLQL